MTKLVVEWAPFALVEGATEDQLLEASHDLQLDFLAAQPGFVRRELLRGPDGAWSDLVYWESQDAALNAANAAAISPVCYRYFQLMKGADHADPGDGVQHFALRESYGG